MPPSVAFLILEIDRPVGGLTFEESIELGSRVKIWVGVSAVPAADSDSARIALHSDLAQIALHGPEAYQTGIVRQQQPDP